MLRVRSSLFLLTLAFGVSGCVTDQPSATLPHVSAKAVSRELKSGLSENEKRTLASLRKVNEHPLYVMNYYGSYAHLDDIETEAAKDAKGWGCSLFQARDETGAPLLARNFDWEDNPSLLLFANPPDAYASVSMIDISYLGFPKSKIADIDDIEMQKALLEAPLLPFDGMNDQGLCIGMAAVPNSPVPQVKNGKEMGGVRAIRKMLDEAKNVKEAIAILKGLNLKFTGPQLHYLIADKSGDSAVVELHEGKMHVLKRGEMTNHYLSTSADGVCPRLTKIEAAKKAGKGVMSASEAMELLDAVHQNHTEWSMVYNLRTGGLDVATDHDFGQVKHFSLPDTLRTMKG